jgi:hypothetical protein
LKSGSLGGHGCKFFEALVGDNHDVGVSAFDDSGVEDKGGRAMGFDRVFRSAR